jgi:hypothetical protein
VDLQLVQGLEMLRVNKKGRMQGFVKCLLGGGDKHAVVYTNPAANFKSVSDNDPLKGRLKAALAQIQTKLHAADPTWTLRDMETYVGFSLQ